MDAAAESGGTVRFKPGKYLTGSLFVKSGTTLDVGEGVTLIGSQKLDDYPMLPTRVAGIEMTWPAALINVRDQRHVTIRGKEPSTATGLPGGSLIGISVPLTNRGASLGQRLTMPGGRV